jgi:hypothetical protein
MGLKGVKWIHVTQDTNQWRALVNTVINLRVSKKAEHSLKKLSALLASQSGRRSIQIVTLVNVFIRLFVL